MIVTCEQCGTQYQLSSEQVKPEGSTVRCSKCLHTFVALPSHDNGAELSGPSVFPPNGAEKDEPVAFRPAEEHPSEPTSPSEAASIPPGDVELPGLADELDRIFGTDETDGALFSNNEEEPIEKAAPDRLREDIETLDLSELDDDLNQLLDKEYQVNDESTGLEQTQIDDFESEPDNLENIAQDEKKIESLGLELEKLDDLELAKDEVPSKESTEPAEHSVLNTIQIESLDLELAPPAPQARNADSSDENVFLDTKQISSLSLDLESTDFSEVSEPSVSDSELKEKPTPDQSVTLDTDQGKRPEILNLNLERPDLDGPSDVDDGIDLPELDELLAPAEVTDENLVDESLDQMVPESEPDAIDESTDFTLEPIPDILDEPLSLADDAKPDIDEKVMSSMEAVFPDDSQPTLELENIGEALQIEEERIEPEEVQPTTPTEPEITPPAEREVPADATAAETVKAAGATAETTQPEKFKPLPRRRTGKWVIAPLAIVLLLAALLGINTLGVKIPGVSDWLGDLNIPFMSDSGQSKSNDPGNARIKTADIDSKFINNNKNGPLFVITGEVLNQYDTVRGFIQVKGNIYAGGGKLVESKSVHCGNILTDMDLAAKSFDDIQSYLSNNLGSGGTGTLNVKPGQSLPFMIVFAGLPPDIEEFTIEVIDSAAL